MAKQKRQPQAESGAPVRPSNRQTSLDAQRKAKQRKDMFKWLTAGLALAMVAVVVLIVTSQDDSSASIPGGPENPATVVAGPVIPSYVSLDGQTMGEPNAPILVVEYGDYQCPFCTQFARADQPKLIKDYVESGKIRFQFSELPIVGSNTDGSVDQEVESFRAAEAAMCARDQGQFWTYHDLLYANTIGEFKGSFTPDRLKAIARQAPGMDLVAFDACIDNRTHTQTVLDQIELAHLANVSNTPTFIVNGKPVVGADYAELARVIDEQVAGP